MKRFIVMILVIVLITSTFTGCDIHEVINGLISNQCEHQGGVATCTDKAICELCGESYGDINHNETNWIYEKGPTEIADGYKYKECKTCGQKTEEAIIPFVAVTELECYINPFDNICKIIGIGSYGDSKLEIPEYIKTYSVSAIDSSAFQNCHHLVNITIPNTVTSIGSFAFDDCTSLEMIVIPDSVTSLGHGAFSGCSSLSNVIIPSSVTHLGTSLFAECVSLESIVIPDTVTIIDDRVFYGCTALKSITIPDGVYTIDSSVFEDCTSLVSINIPNTVISIETAAFRGCTSLESITIPDSVFNISERAFENCTALTSVTIPASVKNMIYDVFRGCTSLTSINFQGTIERWNSLKKFYQWDENTGEYIIYCTNGEITKDGTITYYQ